MTANEIRKEVEMKYKIGQTVNLRMKDTGDHKMATIKVKILKFNDCFVLVERIGLGFKESYRYWDFVKMTSDNEVKNIINEAVDHKGKVAS